MEPDQVGRKVGQSIKSSVRRSVLDDDVVTFDIAQGPQAVAEGFHA
jgi:hypothetical protein